MKRQGPYEREPAPSRLGFEDRYELLMEALDGLDLGAYDEIIVRWLCHNLDARVFPVLVTWLERCRGLTSSA